LLGRALHVFFLSPIYLHIPPPRRCPSPVDGPFFRVGHGTRMRPRVGRPVECRAVNCHGALTEPSKHQSRAIYPAIHPTPSPTSFAVTPFDVVKTRMQAQNQPRPAPGTMCPCGGNIRILHLFEWSLLAIPTCCTHKYPIATGPFPSALPTPVWSNLTTFVSNRHTPRPAVPLAAPWLLPGCSLAAGSQRGLGHARRLDGPPAGGACEQGARPVQRHNGKLTLIPLSPKKQFAFAAVFCIQRLLMSLSPAASFLWANNFPVATPTAL